MGNCKTCGTPSTPTPYYEDVGNNTTQDHASIFRDTAYAAGVVINDEFQIPAVNTDIQVCVKNLVDIVIGSYLWHPTLGYLKINYWDSCSKKIGLLNEGLDGTAPAGTVISECTAFVSSARPCCVDEDNFSLFPFLAEDFEAPGVGNQVTLHVTSTFGLVVGTNVRIGTCLYHLDTINSSLEIVVTNEGAGCTPSSTIFAKDGDGSFQYLITTQIISACSATVTDIGRLIICNGADEQLLDGDFPGQVPILRNRVTDEVSFGLLDTSERVCTILTTALNITALNPTYTIHVDDESIFDIGQILQINFSNLRWEITDNTTPGELDITCTTGNPGVTITVPIGSAVCLILCCENVQSQIDAAEIDITDLQAALAAIPAAIQNQQYTFAVSTGSANAQVIALTPVPSGPLEGQVFIFRAGFTNTAGMTFNAGFGVASVSDQRTGAALIGGEVVAGNYYIIVDTGGTWKLINPTDTRPGTWLGQWWKDATAAGLSNVKIQQDVVGAAVITRKTMPRAGKVTQLTMDLSAVVGLGNIITGTLFKNGVSTGQSIIISNDAVNVGKAQSITPQSFIAGDYLEISMSATLGGNVTAKVDIFGSFTD